MGLVLRQYLRTQFITAMAVVRQKSMPYKAYVSESYLVTFEYDELFREIEPGKTKNQSNYFDTQYNGLNIFKRDTLGNTRKKEYSRANSDRAGYIGHIVLLSLRSVELLIHKEL